MTSKLAMMQARFQEKQMQEKEEKLLRFFEDQQQKTVDRINRGSPISTSIKRNNINNSISQTTTSTNTGKVRQMFEERRQKAGIDKKYPLEPLKGKSKPANIYQKTSPSDKSYSKVENNNNYVQYSVRAAVQKKISQVQNGKPVINEKKITKSIYTNNNGKESYKEESFVENNAIDKNLANRMNNIKIGDSLDDQELIDVNLEKLEDHTKNQLIKKSDAVSQKTKPIIKTVQSRAKKTSSGSTTFLPNPGTSSSKTVLSTKKQDSSNFQSQSGIIKTNTNPTMSQSKQKTENRAASEKQAPSSARPSTKPRQQPSAIIRDDLEPCRHCGRRFAADRLQVHEDICARAGKKQRKTFDASKHRVQGTELEQYTRKRKPGKGIKMLPPADWRKRHEEFIATIRAAKVAQAHIAKGGKISDLPPPPPSYNPDYVECPHCGRRFNQAAAERHIPKCATYQFNKPKPQAPPRGFASNKSR